MTYKIGEDEFSLWNEQDGMYYDAIDFGNGHSMQLPVRSLVGLIPLYATLVLEPAVINRLPGFKKRMEWFINNRTEMADRNMANMKGEILHRIPSSSLIPLFTQLPARSNGGYWR
jgi:hypothetical protein